jgi:signal transduction histidine kinase
MGRVHSFFHYFTILILQLRVMLFKKQLVILFFLTFFYAVPVYSQDSLYRYKFDSLAASLKTVKTDEEKAKVLTLLIDLSLSKFNYGLNDTVYIHKLMELSSFQKVDNIAAYKALWEGLEFFHKKDFLKAQNSFKKAIPLFDRTHKKIPGLLIILRETHNQIGNQEDRYQFYTQKLHQYSVNGPVENVAACYLALAGYYLYKADYNLAISNYLKAMDIFKNYSPGAYMNLLDVVASTYVEWGNYQKAMEYLNILFPLAKARRDTFLIIRRYVNLAKLYLAVPNYPKALVYADSAISVMPNSRPMQSARALAHLTKAASLIGLNQLREVPDDLNKVKKIQDSAQFKILGVYGAMETDYVFYQYYSAIKKFDDAAKSLLTALQKAVDVKSNSLQLKYLKELSIFYGQRNQPALAFDYTRKFYDLMDSLDRDHSAFKVAQYENEKKELRQNDSLNVLKQRGAVQTAIIKKNDIMLWGALVAIVLISVSMFFVYRQYHFNKKTLHSLRKTQKQLVTAEKMASLGELTAGIAHEIQNPLNFVNNFSEVSNELLDEMKQELATGNGQQASQIADDVKQNLEKIIHHGKRADGIVKGMLMHSRASSGQKEPTDINLLADEYLRLSYHGLRAKDKTFQAKFETHFDKTIEKISVLPQDIGRVLLNLFTNAFYSVTKKNKQHPEGYEPCVSVTTKRLKDKIEIRVWDNGMGIPQKVMDKIFQPFFTTKPTGEGTGLGLSLSYDIITKGHGGELKAETKEGEFAEFIILLPDKQIA